MKTPRSNVIHRILAIALAGASLPACDTIKTSLPPEESVTVPSEGSVRVYVEVRRRTARPILDSFTEQSGVEVEATYLEEVGEGFFGRLKNEAAAGRVDVFWGTSPLFAIELQRAGLTVPFRTVGARPVPGQYYDPGFHWTGFAVNPRVLIYNDERVSRGEAPRSLRDLTRQPWAGKGAMARIGHGTPAFHAASLFSIWGYERGRDFFESIESHGNLVAKDDDEILRLVASGEALWGFLDLDRAICAKRYSEPIHIFFPDRLSLGSVVPPHVAVLLRKAPNLDQAKGLFAYLFSTETAWQLGQFDCALMSLLPDIPRPDWIPALGAVNVTQVDNQAVYDAYRDNAGFFASWGSNSTTNTPDP